MIHPQKKEQRGWFIAVQGAEQYRSLQLNAVAGKAYAAG